MNSAERRVRGAVIDALAAPGTHSFEHALTIAARRLRDDYIARGGRPDLATGEDFIVRRYADSIRADYQTVTGRG